MQTIHSVGFQTEIRAPSSKHIQQRDESRARHFVAGHHAHGPLSAIVQAHRHHQGQQPQGQQPMGEQPNPDGPSPSSPGPNTSISVTNAAVTYLVDVGVGSPPEKWKLLIDTGSSNCWINGANGRYHPSASSVDTRKPFQISYGKGACSGQEYTDIISLSDKLVVKNQSVGVATQMQDMDGVGSDGILGIGPVDLTEGTVDGTPIPTLPDNMLKQGLIQQEVIGIYYEPTTTDNAPTGCLTFGGPDTSKCTSEIKYNPITQQDPAKKYWGMEQSITYDGEEIMSLCPGIADTGTTLFMLPDAVLQKYMAKTGAKMDPSTGLMTVTDAQYNKMQSMFITIGDTKYEFTKNAQIWPRSMNSTLGVPDDQISLVFASMGKIQQGNGLCFINGMTFLQRFYSVYDTTNARLGFATTQHTMATTN